MGLGSGSLGFRVEGLGSGSLGFRVEGLGVSEPGFRIYASSHGTIRKRITCG